MLPPLLAQVHVARPGRRRPCTRPDRLIGDMAYSSRVARQVTSMDARCPHAYSRRLRKCVSLQAFRFGTFQGALPWLIQ
jgi:hypothetical protein